MVKDLITLVIIVVVIASLWKIFVKAGHAGWKAIIPIYSTIIMLQIVGMSPWFVLLGFIPLVNLGFFAVVGYKLSKAFGKGIGTTILMFIGGIGYIILGFGKAQYTKPAAVAAGPAAPGPVVPGAQAPPTVPPVSTPPTNPMPPPPPSAPTPPPTPPGPPPPIGAA